MRVCRFTENNHASLHSVNQQPFAAAQHGDGKKNYENTLSQADDTSTGAQIRLLVISCGDKGRFHKCSVRKASLRGGEARLRCRALQATVA